jgi:hypothetical protein
MHIRTKIIIVTLGLSALSVIVLSAISKQLPSDESLRTRFVAHRVDFERLVVMTNEDSHLTRIAPDFTWLDHDAAWPRKNVGISESRWEDYRQIFQTVGASEGLIKYSNPTEILIPITSIGLVPSGVEKGLAYSQTSLSPVLKSLNERPPEEFWNGTDRSHVLVYEPIGDHWYIYYRQW